MNRENIWSLTEIVLVILNTLSFLPVLFFVLLLVLGSPKNTLDFIVTPLLFFTVSVFVADFVVAALQFDKRRNAAWILFAAGVSLVFFSVILLVFRS
ncbi:MAG: hypothetical protein ACR2KZ_04995 [Segetibacter sp.]